MLQLKVRPETILELSIVFAVNQTMLKMQNGGPGPPKSYLIFVQGIMKFLFE